MMEQSSLLFLLLIFWNGIFATCAIETDYLVDSPIEDDQRGKVALNGILCGCLISCIVIGCFIGGYSFAKHIDNEKQNIVGAGQRKVLSEKKTIHFRFHDFADKAHELKRGKFIESNVSPPFLGNRFVVCVFPRGGSSSSTDDDYVSVYLKSILNEGIERLKVKFSIQAGPTLRSATNTFERGRGKMGFGWKNFAKLADVLDETQQYIFAGTLTIKVDVQEYVAKPEVWKPNRTNEHNIHENFEIGKSADVVLRVGDKQFCVHKSLLAKSAPVLFEATEDATALDVDYKDPLAFRKMLLFINYGVLPFDFKGQAMALLDVADTFGCTNLKLFAEAKLAANIRVDNAMEMYVLADSKNCALLKEATLDFFALQSQAVLKTPGYSLVKESPRLMAELLETQMCAPIYLNETDDVNRMKVRALRRRLEKAGLDVDGSRETLVKRLKAVSK